MTSDPPIVDSIAACVSEYDLSTGAGRGYVAALHNKLSSVDFQEASWTLEKALGL